MSGIDLGGFRITLIREDIYWWDAGVMFGVVMTSIPGSWVSNENPPASAIPAIGWPAASRGVWQLPQLPIVVTR